MLFGFMKEELQQLLPLLLHWALCRRRRQDRRRRRSATDIAHRRSSFKQKLRPSNWQNRGAHGPPEGIISGRFFKEMWISPFHCDKDWEWCRLSQQVFLMSTRLECILHMSTSTMRSICHFKGTCDEMWQHEILIFVTCPQCSSFHCVKCQLCKNDIKPAREAATAIKRVFIKAAKKSGFN